MYLFSPKIIRLIIDIICLVHFWRRNARSAGRLKTERQEAYSRKEVTLFSIFFHIPMTRKHKRFITKSSSSYHFTL